MAAPCSLAVFVVQDQHCKGDGSPWVGVVPLSFSLINFFENFSPVGQAMASKGRGQVTANKIR